MTFCSWLYTETDKIIREGKPITDINLPNKITASIIPIVQPKIVTPTVQPTIITPVVVTPTVIEVPKPAVIIDSNPQIPITVPDPMSGKPIVPTTKPKNVVIGVSDNASTTDQ